jgi:hypothetical protein
METSSNVYCFLPCFVVEIWGYVSNYACNLILNWIHTASISQLYVRIIENFQLYMLLQIWDKVFSVVCTIRVLRLLEYENKLLEFFIVVLSAEENATTVLFVVAAVDMFSPPAHTRTIDVEIYQALTMGDGHCTTSTMPARHHH